MHLRAIESLFERTKLVERHGLAPAPQLVPGDAARLDVILPQLTTGQTELLHRNEGCIDRPVAKTVALNPQVTLWREPPDGWPSVACIKRHRRGERDAATDS